MLPQETLTIQGGRDYYRINENVKFDCISGNGWPLMSVNWFINDKPVCITLLSTSVDNKAMYSLEGTSQISDPLQANCGGHWAYEVQVGPQF